MSKRLDVIEAVKALVDRALPEAEVLGLDGDEAPATRVRAGGRVIVRTGDPGEPEVDLSPLAYNWTHRIPLELAMPDDGGGSEAAVDEMMAAIGAAILADRHLGGLCEWLDAAAPLTEDIYAAGAKPPRGGLIDVVAMYVTASPLN
jgi:hypothetical protein